MAKVARALVRLPTVIFPGQALSFKICNNNNTVSPFSLPRDLVTSVWKKHGGKVAAFGPSSRIGIELNLMYDDVLDALVPTPDGVSHAMGGDRVRLVRTIGQREPNEQHPICEVVPVEDVWKEMEAK